MEINESALYCYRARVTRVVDGDTVDAEVDLGFSVKIAQRLRLYGMDAPEKRGEEREAGKKAAAHLVKLLTAYALNQQDGQMNGNCSVVLVRTIKDKKGKYGRMLAEIWGEHEGELVNLNAKMVEDGYATRLES